MARQVHHHVNLPYLQDILTFGSKTTLVVSPTESMRSSRLGSVPRSVASSRGSFAIAPGLSALAERTRQEALAKKEEHQKQAEQRRQKEIEAALAKEKADREAEDKRRAEIMRKAKEDETRRQLLDAAKAIEKEQQDRATAEKAAEKAAATPEPEGEVEPDDEDHTKLIIDLGRLSPDAPKVVTVITRPKKMSWFQIIIVTISFRRTIYRMTAALLSKFFTRPCQIRSKTCRPQSRK